MAGRTGSNPPPTGVEQALTELLLPALAPAGIVVEELRLTPAGKRRILKVLIDRDPYAGVADPVLPADVPVDGLSLDEVADASRVVSDRLDQLAGGDDPLDGTPYTLEVSSPGVERPLTLPRHYRRNVGRLVDLKTVDGSSLRCRITAATPDSVTVETSHGPRELTWSDVLSATVQVEFKRVAKAPEEPGPEPEPDQPDDRADEEG
jgi:ribosome maturation factor RimP